ncbi:MAG: DUF4365 domain-containing protein [Coriobacteriia bacterium]|nr:DUF4365 domain-containing protein [Coriobacteriia bacterium]
MPKRPDAHVLADRAVNAFEQVVVNAGWVWNPTRAGGDYGIDGFVSPRDAADNVLPFEIPVQVKGVTVLRRTDDHGVAHAVTRETVNLLRAHVLGGYFVVYDASQCELFYVHSEVIGREFDASSCRSKRLRVALADSIDATSLVRLAEDALRRHDALRHWLAIDENLRLVRDFYLQLTVLQEVFFNFVAAIATVSPDHVLGIALSMARGGSNVELDDDALQRMVADWNEYDVRPPTEYLGNLPGLQVMLATIQFVHELVNELTAHLGSQSRDALVVALGLEGLQRSVREVSKRAFNIDPEVKPLEPGIHWITVNTIHYVLGSLQVSLIVNRLVHELRNVVFEGFDATVLHSDMGGMLSHVPDIWMRHITDEVQADDDGSSVDEG